MLITLGNGAFIRIHASAGGCFISAQTASVITAHLTEIAVFTVVLFSRRCLGNIHPPDSARYLYKGHGAPSMCQFEGCGMKLADGHQNRVGRSW